MLKYTLQENLLTERPDDYMAQTIATRSYDKEAVIELILRRGSLLTRTDVLAVLNGLEETVADIIKDGGTVNLPLFNTSFSISGVFDSPMDTFDGGRHKLNVNLSKGTLLRDTEKQVRFTKTDALPPAFSIAEIKDVVSGTTNTLLTPGGVIQLWGSNLKLAGDHPDVGLWFVPETGEAVKATVIVTNKPASLIAMIPSGLTAGNYRLRIATQYSSGSSLLKESRVNVSDKTLKVE